MSAARIIPVGTAALLVEVEDAPTARAWFLEARRRGVDAVDVVPAARTVLFDGVADPEGLALSLEHWHPDPGHADPGHADPAAPGDARCTADADGPAVPPVEVPTVYDGPDLDTVARLWGMTRAEVVATHTDADLSVAFCGFAPGFPYCTGLPAHLSVPRLERPRTRVAAGSVGLAGEFTGVYPSASPGGWRLIGRTDLVLWDSDRADPATLPPGTRVRFVETTA